MLVAQRLMQWWSVVLASALALALVDYALRLPGWLRLVIGVGLAAAAVTWLWTRLRRASAFWPSLGELALRAERMYPHLAGALASAVEFSEHAEQYRDPRRTATMATETIRRVQDRLPGVSLMRLIDPSRTARLLAVMVGVLILVSAAVAASPTATRTAAARWLMPLGDAQWPQRTAVHSRMTQPVWAIDAPLKLAANVSQGYHHGMRVWVYYRVTPQGAAPGPWREALMNDQGVGLFERLIELPPGVARAVSGDAAADVEFYFKAGDAQTPPQHLELVARPAVTGITAAIRPPGYAADLIGEQTVALHEQTTPVATAAAWPGSVVTLTVELNKPIPDEAAAVALPGLAAAAVERTGPTTLTASFGLRDTVDTLVRLTDEHGLANLSDRLYRIEATPDKPPTVSIVKPSADESVLASAVIEVEALGQDDVGLAELSLDAEVPNPAPSGSAQNTLTLRLAETAQRRAMLTASATFDLAPLDLQPGQLVTLVAAARDVYELDGLTHDPVLSPPRRLRIIDETTLIGQLRAELAALRQQAIRLEQTQRQLAELDPAAAAGQQAQLSSRLESQAQLLERLQQRAASNRLDEPALDQVMNEAARLVQEAQDASDRAQERLDDAARQAEDEARKRQAAEARQSQAEVGDAMRELTELLDQGRDALTLQLQLRQLQTQQGRLAQDTRELLPQTVGQDRADLPQELQDALDELARRQAELSDQAQSAVRQMQATAEALNQPGGSDRERAAAEALAEAAAIAQRQGLSQQMDQAGESAQQNQLSQAGQQQANAMDTMQQMLRELDQQEQRVQQMVRRRLQELIQAIAQLLERQRAHAALLEEAPDVSVLEPGQAAIRRGTMAAEQTARASEQTQPVAEVLARAVDHQADAVLALRDSALQPARLAEGKAIESLAEALELVRQQAEQEERDQAQEQREELQRQYLELAERQDDLSDRAAAVVEAGVVTRPGRAQLIAVAGEEEEVRAEAMKLSAKVNQTLVFTRIHRWLDEGLSRAVSQLRRGRADESVLAEQARASRLLREMAAALEEDAEPSEFAGEQGGGGGGGGGPPPQVVPPVAELKLLRSIQQDVYEATRGLDESGPAAETRRRRLSELSAQQRELSQLGVQMVENMEKAMQPAALPQEETPQ